MTQRSKIRNWLVMAAVLLCTAVSVKAFANPGVRRPVVQFIYFYEQSETSQDTQSLGLWDRLLYSVLMTKASSS